jgi:CHAD domain-containing protein
LLTVDAPGATAVRDRDDAKGAQGDMSLLDPIARALDLVSTVRAPGVRGDDPWPEAGRKILRLQFARMLARVPGVIAGEDPEEVHAMRVATRRMRAAWRVFGDGFERGSTRRYRRDLREVGARLGAVRDLDVLLEILDGHGARHGSRTRAGLAPLRRAWAADRGARQDGLVDLVSSPAFADFVAEYEVLLGAEAGAGDAVARVSPGRVRSRMPAVAWSAYQDVWAFEERLDGADLATLHQLRIAGKWLRYTLEFVREVLDADAIPLIGPVTALQDHLGAQHDLHVAATLARGFAEADGSLSPRERSHVDGFVLALGERVDWYGRRFPRAWQPLVTPAYRSRLGRALARL